MNNTTTAPLNDGAQMSGNNTANNQNTITLNRNDVGEYKSLIADLVLEGFWGYFKAQPVAIAMLGERMQHTKSIPEREALSRFVGAIEQINDFVYGIIERALIPFGLHHVFYMPFWQTAVGGTAIIDGVTVQGAQNIFFAELASKATTVFSVSATRFMSGKFPFMIFGLVGAALAVYHTARPEKKKVVGGLLLSAALTSMLTGITEPLEFTFLFVAPLMYVVHCIYAGLSYMLMHIFNVGVGMTFSGGLIDLTLFGILQGNARTNWIWVVIVGAVYFFLYYFTFRVMITKMDLATPGRESDDQEPKLYTRSDYKEKTDDRVQALAVISGLADKDKYPAIKQLFRTEMHASPYMEKYVLDALCEMRYIDEAIIRIKRRYKQMVEEDFNVKR